MVVLGYIWDGLKLFFYPCSPYLNTSSLDVRVVAASLETMVMNYVIEKCSKNKKTTFLTKRLYLSNIQFRTYKTLVQGSYATNISGLFE